jgi:hypothetical protein
MERKLSVAELPINASPAAMHHRQMFRQVWLPLIASIVILLVLVILTLIGAVQESPLIEKWGNFSAIYIIIPVLFSGLLLLALLAGSIYGMRKLLRALPGWMWIAQMHIASLAVMIRRAADATTRPVFAAHLSSARARALWKQFFH